MLKRIAIVAFFTGTGQLFSIFVLKYLSHHSSTSQIQAIAEIDSLVFFIMNLIALGLQSVAIRNLAQLSDWKKEYDDTQRARIAFGLLLMTGALFSFINPYYLVFLIAPVMGWSGDYALYARGYPVKGSIVAFLRLAIPFSALLIAAFYFPAHLGWVYMISLGVVYILTNLYISFFLKTDFVFLPSFKNLHLYIRSLPLGIVSVSLYMIGLGLILIVPYLYIPEVVAIAFVGLKFYVIFKGVLRIIHQAFIKEMMRYEVCLKVDQLCSLIGLTFASFTLFFPATFTKIFFGSKYLPNQLYFVLLALAGLVYSLFSSLTTKAMLEKKDKTYATVAAVSALLTIILCVFFSLTDHTAKGIGISVLIGEVVFAGSMLWMMKKPELLRERILFLLRNLPLAIIPLGCSYFLDDQTYSLLIAITVFTIILVYLYHNKFNLVSDEPVTISTNT